MADFVATVVGLYHRHTSPASFILIVRAKWTTRGHVGGRTHQLTQVEYLLEEGESVPQNVKSAALSEMRAAAERIYPDHAAIGFHEAEQLSIGVRRFGSSLDLFLAGRKQPVLPHPSGYGRNFRHNIPDPVTSMPSCLLLLNRYLSQLRPTSLGAHYATIPASESDNSTWESEGSGGSRAAV
jgi:hypothetical protein